MDVLGKHVMGFGAEFKSDYTKAVLILASGRVQFRETKYQVRNIQFPWVNAFRMRRKSGRSRTPP